MRVTDPRTMNETFARAFNSREISNLLALYEDSAVLKIDGSGKTLSGKGRISPELQEMLKTPGRMVSKNNFCIEHDDLALLRADWSIITDDGAILVAGSSAEVVRRQADGRWLYVIDHAAGAGLPRV
jgi:ketosteroid isomerase-like protein